MYFIHFTLYVILAFVHKYIKMHSKNYVPRKAKAAYNLKPIEQSRRKDVPLHTWAIINDLYH
jgi:hypothetical protein